MPRINNPDVIDVLNNPYFDHHAAMHLCRERLIANPKDVCSWCDEMTPAGEKESGREFLDMHHEMIRVFKYLLFKDKSITFQPRKGVSSNNPKLYEPVVWDLDDYSKLPPEIIDLFRLFPNYLKDAFSHVKEFVALKAIDELGIFIERGEHPIPDGDGIHNLVHEYLGSKEGGFAAGAEMNKLRDSMYNDYFWSLHLWIEGQYQRAVEKAGGVFDTSQLDPESTGCNTAKNHHPTKGKSHVAMAGM